MNNIKITIHPLNIELFTEKNSNLMDVLVFSGIKTPNYCGGTGSCKKCLVKLINGQLSDNAKYGEYYLACQAKILSDIVIELINFSQNTDNKAISVTDNFSIESLDSGIKKINLSLDIPDQDNKTADLYRLKNSLDKNYNLANFEAIQNLPLVLRENNWNISVIVDEFKQEILDIISPEDSNIFGLAIDIGTTTINIVLADLQTGKVIDNESSFNNQLDYGADVISRIMFSEKPSGLDKLHNVLVDNINSLIKEIIERNNINKDNIYSAIISGNTTMIHFFAKVFPKYIRIAPYVPAFSELRLKAQDVNLIINKNASLYCFPCVGSYVGGDIISGILASKMWQEDKIRLFIDIGTNGEIVLGNSEWLLSCACSAGPAFEGAGVTCGVRAIDGAIEKISINPDNLELIIKTINSKSPIGICGSGMIDVVAELFKAGLIDRQGKFSRQINDSRIIMSDNKAYLLITEKSDSKQPIIITEQDIENIIRTKGAIFSGIISLLNYAGIGFDDIDEILIAGGIGKSINFDNAIAIGLLPYVSISKYKYLGNTSLQGAYLALIDKQNYENIEKIRSIINYFDISEDNNYMNSFISSLFIPHTDLSLFQDIIN